MAVRWFGDFLAWANNLGVKIYDMSTNERVSFISFPTLAGKLKSR